MTALVIEGLRSGWGETQILNGISLEVDVGQTLVVLGRNGVGKSTLLSTLVGRATHKGGSILFQDRAIETEPSHVRARRGIGLVPQEREIFRSLSVEENLTVAARGRAWDLARVYDLFPRLKERRTNSGNQLSGGEQQMLSIGRALMGSPCLLLMDEPLEGLAPVIVEYLIDVIRRLQQETEMAIIIVEQHVDIALEFSENVAVLDRGSVVYENREPGAAADRGVIESLVGVGAE